MTSHVTGVFGRLFFSTGLIERACQPFEPDFLFDGAQQFDLASYGVSGWILPPPGHTHGSLCIALDDGQALVGDLLSFEILLGGVALTGRAKRPPFEHNPALVAVALERLAAACATNFYMGYGGPLPRGEVLRRARNLRRGFLQTGPRP